VWDVKKIEVLAITLGHNKPLVFVSGLCFNILFEIGWFLKLSIVDMEDNCAFCTKPGSVENVDYCKILRDKTFSL